MSGRGRREGYDDDPYDLPTFDGFDAQEDDDMIGGQSMFTSRALTPRGMTLSHNNAVDNFFDSLGPYGDDPGIPSYGSPLGGPSNLGGMMGPPPRRDHLGMRAGPNPSGGLYGAYDSNLNERPSLLDQGFADPGMRPTALDAMGPIYGGWSADFEMEREYDRGWPGWNDSMPLGAVGYVGRDEHRMWGQPGGLRMYPGEIVDDEFVRRRELDERWEPEGYDEGMWGVRLRPRW